MKWSFACKAEWCLALCGPGISMPGVTKSHVVMNYKVRVHANPINIACLVMLFISMVTVLSLYYRKDGRVVANQETPAHFHHGKECQYEGLECPILRQTHVCIDKTHLNCDGECSCDGMECPKPVDYIYPITWRDFHEYQVEVEQNRVVFYDRGRKCFTVPLHENCSLTRAIEKDNE